MSSAWSPFFHRNSESSAREPRSGDLATPASLTACQPHRPLHLSVTQFLQSKENHSSCLSPQPLARLAGLLRRLHREQTQRCLAKMTGTLACQKVLDAALSPSLHEAISELFGATLWPCWNLQLSVTRGAGRGILTSWRRKARNGARTDKPRKCPAGHLPLQPAPTFPWATPGRLPGQTYPSCQESDGTQGPSASQPASHREGPSPCTHRPRLSCDQVISWFPWQE